MCIKWCGGDYKTLFTGGVDATIHAYDVISMKEKGVAEDTSGGDPDNKIRHSQTILDLLPIPDMQLIASASLDTNMCLWNMHTLQGKSIH